jgi:hypothetical protein
MYCRRISSIDAHKCETWLDDASGIYADEVTIPRCSWPVLQEHIRKVAHALIRQLSTMITLGRASQLCTSINDDNLVAWYRIREQWPASSLRMLIEQREEKLYCYRMLVNATAAEMMSDLFLQDKESTSIGVHSNSEETVAQQLHSQV